jgi:hypothetical protein
MYLLRHGTALLIILGDDNIERIKQQDPVELKLSEVYKSGVPTNDIGITYLNTEDIETLITLMKAGRVNDAFKFATRGWKFQPQRGDHDMGPTDVLAKVDA